MSFGKSILENGRSIDIVNATFLVLIPKVEQPESIFQSIPINLCNISYKLITNIIVLWLRDYLGDIVSPN